MDGSPNSAALHPGYACWFCDLRQNLSGKIVSMTSLSPYPILSVRSDDLISDEALGSKTKFWFQQDGRRWLFKEARDNTGEGWAEKIAAEVAALMDISAATVELAEYEGRHGCASLMFVNSVSGEVLYHGNEILAGQVLGYDPDKKFRQSDHTLENIRAAICKLFPDPEMRDEVLTTLASYLVLDAIIGNTDRHHENWGLLLRPSGEGDALVNAVLSVAPSFDHASSLGRELRDEKRLSILRSAGMDTYVRKGHGAVFFAPEDAHGANPLRLVEFGANRVGQYFLPGLERMRRFTIQDLDAVVDCVPDEHMTATAKAFTKAFLAYTYESLCNLLK